MCDITGNEDDRDRSRRPDTEDHGWSSTGRILGGRTIGRSDDVVCGLHRTQGDEEHKFLCLTTKLRLTVSPDLASKSVASGFSV
jgi:hypothetical protein